MAEEGIEEEGTGDTRSAPAREVFQRRSIFLGFLTGFLFFYFQEFYDKFFQVHTGLLRTRRLISVYHLWRHPSVFTAKY